jgi:cobalt-zinc-cadmium efflux system membrane fusion protein
LEVFAPALPDRRLTAALHYVGREVSAKTNAVPLMAVLPNPDGLLRPGQFVQVRLPVGEPQRALAVPEAAVVVHEGKPFVFRREAEGSFRRVDIQRGVSSEGWIEVIAGLSEGDAIVVQGAFYLKSELLLEREE